jgi:ring-1,2-phenylacetyl-CoA epoxidase subunit PaaE
MAAVKTRRTGFTQLAVCGIDHLTDDAVALSFDVPEPLRQAYAFAPGQHITVRRYEDGADVRRSYSLCSTPQELTRHGRLRIAVRQIPGGAFSSFAVHELRPGDLVEVSPPLGQFTTALDPGRTRHYAAIAAGSGITPVFSVLATALATEASSRFTLLYGNRATVSVMFADELADLKDRYPGRLHLVHVLSREPQLSALLSGRLDGERLRAILDTGLVDESTVDEWFLCGPYGMVEDVRGVLAERGVALSAVHTELFHVDSVPPPPARPGAAEGEARVTMTLDGRESTFAMSRDGRVLDAALTVRPELPFACKGGVCSTCRARLVEGEVVMAHNYALEPDELAAGYVLTCQSSPVTDRVVLDYDA